MPNEREFHDITKDCKDCGEPFTVEAGEQRWLYEKFGDDFNVPVRCKPCRKLKKERHERR